MGANYIEYTTPEDLLDEYLASTRAVRRERFADTAQAAELAGMSQRTIQLWIEIGAILAVRVGHRYQVDLNSLRAYLRRNAAV